MVTFLLLVSPALLTPRRRHATIAPPAAARELAAPICARRPGAATSSAPGSTPMVAPRAFERQDSNILSVLARADLLFDLPAEAGDLDAGDAEVVAIDLAVCSATA